MVAHSTCTPRYNDPALLRTGLSSSLDTMPEQSENMTTAEFAGTSVYWHLSSAMEGVSHHDDT